MPSQCNEHDEVGELRASNRGSFSCCTYHKSDFFFWSKLFQQLKTQLVTQNARLTQTTFNCFFIFLTAVRTTPRCLEHIVYDGYYIF